MRKVHPTSNINWVLVYSTGLFFAFVLFIYEAYGIHAGTSFSGHTLIIRAIVFGLLTSFAYFTGEKWIKPLFIARRIGKYHPHLFIGTILGTTFTFLAYNYFWQWGDLDLVTYLQFLWKYPTIVMIPLLVSLLIARLQNSQPKEEEELETERKLITIHSENGKEKFSIDMDDLLFIKAEDNYVNIHFLQEGKVQNHLLRNRLLSLEESFNGHIHLIRCHRSYIVNLKQISRIIKKENHFKLTVLHETEVPVSKKYIEEVSEKIKSLSLTPYTDISPQK